VYAGVRREADGESLVSEESRIRPVLMDVTSSASVSSAVQSVLDQGHSKVNALINNAGKVTLAPLEFMDLDVFESQLAVNLTGVVRVTQAFLPLLRNAAASGSTARIVMMGSQSGTCAYPLFGGYSASKFGLEAVSDVLRYELDSQGIKVVLLKPGAIKTPLWDRGNESSSKELQKMPESAMDLYGELIDRMTVLTQKAVDTSLDPSEVSDLVMEALNSPNPRSRYNLGKSARVQILARRLLPDRIWDALLLNNIKQVNKPN
jgi:NAD(P)-dependent dehydrogenase (short-subunit alcohol dehydrogenase family)